MREKELKLNIQKSEKVLLSTTIFSLLFSRPFAFIRGQKFLSQTDENLSLRKFKRMICQNASHFNLSEQRFEICAEAVQNRC